MYIKEILIPTLIITTISLIILHILNKYRLYIKRPTISKIENGIMVFFLNSFIFLYFFYKVSEVIWRDDIIIYLIYSFILFFCLVLLDILEKWKKLNNFLISIIINLILINIWFFIFYF